jgi:hypothetical protein
LISLKREAALFQVKRLFKTHPASAGGSSSSS